MTLPSVGETMEFLGGAFRREGPIADDPTLAQACTTHVTGNARLTPAQQVDIYRRQYFLRHVDSLIEDYPGLRYVIAEEAFDRFCRAYLEHAPPRSFTLRDLGTEIVAFAESYPDFAPDRRALAIDMARYELACVDVFDGADVPPLRPDALLRLSADAWASARFVVNPTMARLRLSYPVASLRRAVVRGETPELPSAAPTPLVVFRRELVVHFELLEPEAFDLLEAIAAGEPLAAACERTAATKSGEAIGAWFRDWASWGLFVDVVSDD